MSRSNRRHDSWDEGPPGADTGSDHSPERSSQSTAKKTNREDPRSGRTYKSYRRSSSDDSDRYNYLKSKKEHIDREKRQSHRDDSNSKDNERKLQRSHSRSLSRDSERHIKDISCHSNERSKKSRRSPSIEKVKSKNDNRIKLRRRRKSYSSSSKSSSSSDNSSKSSTTSSSESHSSSNPSVSDHRSVPNERKITSAREQSVKNNDKVAMPFKNDGSFLEMFKKMQESKSTDENITASTTATAAVSQLPKKPVMPLIMKRRGGRLLKTGLVKKPKAIEEQHTSGIPKDAWSLYMQEVKKYRETSCEEEGKTRPLVK